MKKTGLVPMDQLLHGGLPPGVVDLYGETESGKSAFCAGLLRQASAEGRPAILVATVPIDREALLLMGAPETQHVVQVSDWSALADFSGEIFKDTAEALIIVDSATGLETHVAATERTGNYDINANAQELVDATNYLRYMALATGGTLLLVSEIRANLGQGRAVRSALSVRAHSLLDAQIKFKVVELVSKYGLVAYRKVRATIVKNNEAPPGGEWVLHNFNNTGFDPWLERLKWGIHAGYIINKGSYWVLSDGTIIGPGFAKATRQLKERYEAGNCDGD